VSEESRLDELLAPLRDEGPELAANRPTIDRERVLARMSAATSRAPLERSRRARTMAVLAFAAAMAAAIGVAGVRLVAKRTAEGSLEVTASVDVAWVRSATPAIAVGSSGFMPAEGELVTGAHGRARIRTETGIGIDVGESTRVPLADLAPRSKALRLNAGWIECHVPHLAGGETFSVVAPDATVIVHGTVFSVEVRPDGARTSTTVRVEEGEVVVRHATGDVTLAAQQAWTSRVAPNLIAPAPEAATTVDEPTPREPSSPRGAAHRAPEPAASAPGTLDEETKLLRSGLSAERRGDLSGAIASFEQLLARHPQSPLVPDARAALARVKIRQNKQTP
jgi:hypothetical protein